MSLATTATQPNVEREAGGENAARAHSKKKPDYDFLVRLLLVGDFGVGKSCLLQRYCHGSFSPTWITTIGKLKNWWSA